ncbi:hypothetical protein BDN70DRAFT_968858 [Pholiota conissans]|uniref:Secreted protein n=1 Tax=Pholiota conissans TaxID=109636 RepID=A0A9P6CNB1_9AGAR|nr:hypothetical protein BDN70DRAFT_968858 [Pholiota conissans]
MRTILNRRQASTLYWLVISLLAQYHANAHLLPYSPAPAPVPAPMAHASRSMLHAIRYMHHGTTCAVRPCIHALVHYIYARTSFLEKRPAPSPICPLSVPTFRRPIS